VRTMLLYTSINHYGLVLSQSAATLEAESGYEMETPQAAIFRQYILDGAWDDAEAALAGLGMTDGNGLVVSQ
jgi:WD repeat-containing protein 26